MSYNFIELFSIISLILGCFFILSGSLGLIKLPDVFSRIHAAGLPVLAELLAHSGATTPAGTPVPNSSILWRWSLFYDGNGL